jgi:hypothetical protein
MNRREAQSGKRRKFSRFVEVLDDRVVLSALAAATPAPVASPFGVAQLGKFEHDLERVDRGLNVHAKHLKSYVTDRTVYIQSELARAAARAKVAAQSVSVTSNAGSSAGQGTHGKSRNDQVDQLVASFNSGPVAAAAAQLGVPTSAIENNLQAAHAGAAGAANSSTGRSGAQTTVSSSPVSSGTVSTGKSGSTTTSSTSATARATTTATSATTVIGTAATQVFSNAYTQAGGSITTTFNGVGASLEQAFSTLDTQAGDRIATEIGTFSTAPAESLEPTVRYASGNGVTFTGT